MPTKKMSNLAALLVQMVGVEAYPKACGKCSRGNGPWLGCYINPRQANGTEIKSLFGKKTTCANCSFTTSGKHCEWSLVYFCGPQEQTQPRSQAVSFAEAPCASPLTSVTIPQFPPEPGTVSAYPNPDLEMSADKAALQLGDPRPDGQGPGYSHNAGWPLTSENPDDGTIVVNTEEHLPTMMTTELVEMYKDTLWTMAYLDYIYMHTGHWEFELDENGILTQVWKYPGSWT